MRLMVAIALIFVLFLPFGLKLTVVMNYLANLNHYSTELCENKNKPELNCNGKCHLSKEIKAIEQSPEDAPALPEVVKSEISPFLSPLADFQVHNEFCMDKKLKTDYTEFASTAHTSGIFHPPRV
jgi:hypothetical protein